MNSNTTPSRWITVGLSGGGGTEMPAISPHDSNLTIINCDMSGAYRTEDGGKTWRLYHWQQLTGCPFCAPVFHPKNPKILFAAFSYDGLLRISRDSGKTFSPHGSGLPGGLKHLSIDPDRPTRMLASTPEGLYWSHDNGKQWQRAAGVAGKVFSTAYVRTAPCQVVAATPEALFRSDDGGRRWVRFGRGFPADLQFFAFAGGSDPQRGITRLYCWLDKIPTKSTSSDKGVIYRSEDGGVNWVKVAAMPVGAGIVHSSGDWSSSAHRLLTTNVQPERVYAVKPVFSPADTLYRSDDSGSTWRLMSHGDKTDPRYNLGDNYTTVYFLPTSLNGWCITEAAINPSDPDHLMFSHYCSVFITRNGGRSWRAGETQLAPRQKRPITADHRWVGNGLHNTTTWNYYIAPFDQRRHFACYTDIGMVVSEDAGRSWQYRRHLGPNCYELCFDPAVPGRMWAALGRTHDIPNNNIVTGGHYNPKHNDGAVGYSEDGGTTWSGRTTGMPGSEHLRYEEVPLQGCAGTVTSVILDPTSPVDNRVLYASLFDAGVFRSVDNGIHWEKRSEGLGHPGVNMRNYRLHRHADGTLFCVVTGLRGPNGKLMREGVGLYRSSDEGKSWQAITGNLRIYWTTDYSVDPRDSNIIWLNVCTAPDYNLREGGVYRTTDGGRTWKLMVSKGDLHFGITFHPRNPDWLYMTLTYNGGKVSPLWFSRDAGKSWKDFEDYPFCSAHRVAFDPADETRIFVTTYGASVLCGPAFPS